jgi:hypothetical protein
MSRPAIAYPVVSARAWGGHRGQFTMSRFCGRHDTNVESKKNYVLAVVPVRDRNDIDFAPSCRPHDARATDWALMGLGPLFHASLPLRDMRIGAGRASGVRGWVLTTYGHRPRQEHGLINLQCCWGSIGACLPARNGSPRPQLRAERRAAGSLSAL